LKGGKPIDGTAKKRSEWDLFFEIEKILKSIEMSSDQKQSDNNP
jgi:hypothetical protein